MIHTEVIGQKDRAKIQAIVAASPDAPFAYLVSRLNKAFKNISPVHLVTLGYMIGYSRGTVDTYGEILNNNTPCQREN